VNEVGPQALLWVAAGLLLWALVEFVRMVIG